MRALLLGCSLLMMSMMTQAQNFYLFVGTYTTGKSEGIYVYRFNAQDGTCSPVSSVETDNPSYLAVAPDHEHVYAVNENGDEHGALSSFSFDGKTGKLKLINRQKSGGDYPCYVSVDKSNKWVTVANYGGGNLSVFPLEKDGGLKPFTQHFQHEGKGTNPDRQEKAHVHSVIFTPDEHFLLSPDLGLDQVSIYKFNAAAPDKPLTESVPPAFIKTVPGSGPRHIDFHPNHKFAYLVTEMGGTVVTYQYDNGNFKPLQTLSVVPSEKNAETDKGSADIHVTPNGKFLYVSTRGTTNNISIFSIDQQKGTLTFVGFRSVLGVKPRNFVVDPTGHFLLVANEKSDNVVIFKINQQTGLLTATIKQLQIGNPVCLKMIAVH